VIVEVRLRAVRLSFPFHSPSQEKEKTRVRLDQLGWNSFFARALASQADGLRPARVSFSSRGIYRLWSEAGEVVARLSGSVRDAEAAALPVTGDWVTFEPAAATMLPRRSKISRKQAGRAAAEQVLAANVDVLFVVTALDRDFNPRRLERYLLIAAEGGAAPVIVLNKSDLCDDPLPALRETDRVASACDIEGGIPVVLMSAITGGAAAQLGRHIEPGQTGALLGSSGVGKSTIVNGLLSARAQAVAPVRESDHRGRHTTTSRELFLLEAGWLLIDTPGLREVEPWAEPEVVSAAFDDIASLAAACRFRDCRHQCEPGCAVLQAVSDGDLPQARLENYRKLEGELAHLRRMQDVHEAAEYKRKVKRIHKAMRDKPFDW
jgi:ribosome biogenesis GTPase